MLTDANDFFGGKKDHFHKDSSSHDLTFANLGAGNSETEGNSQIPLAKGGKLIRNKKFVMFM